MGFVQIIEYKTTKIDEIRAVVDKFRGTLPAGSGPVGGTLTQDRDRPNTYVSIIEFESFEKAMENSNRPETGEMAAAMAQLCDAPPTFLNLDIVDRFEG